MTDFYDLAEEIHEKIQDMNTDDAIRFISENLQKAGDKAVKELDEISVDQKILEAFVMASDSLGKPMFGFSGLPDNGVMESAFRIRIGNMKFIHQMASLAKKSIKKKGPPRHL